MRSSKTTLLVAVLNAFFQNLAIMSFIEFILSSLTTLYKLLLTGKKLKVKVKFTLEQATKAQRGSRGIALLFL
jgi:hypothetical protein